MAEYPLATNAHTVRKINVDLIFGSTFGGKNKVLKIAGSEIYSCGEYKTEHTPFLSFTFTREQLIQIRNHINEELKRCDHG